MTKTVTGRDAVARAATGPAADWSPGRPGLVRELRAEARALTSAAIAAGDGTLAGRALAVRSELRAASLVAGYTPPTLEPSGPLPFGPGRPALERVALPEIAWDHREGDYRVGLQVLRRRRGPTALSGLPEYLRAAAARYAGLVEAVAAPGGVRLDAPVTGGISDGGATSRCALAARLAVAHCAIGPSVALMPVGLTAHRDRPRHAITVRGLTDAVCLRQLRLRDVLVVAGWSRRREYEARLSEALKAALDRLSEVV